MNSIDWGTVLKAIGKTLGVALTGAATGFGTTGTWQGAALGAGAALGGLFISKPTWSAPTTP